MLRFARARQSDPSLSQESATSRAAQGRGKPDLDVEFYSLSPEALAAELPPYDDRRAMLTKDPVACADGFRTLVQLGAPTPLRRSLLPQMPGLREFQQALHGRVRQQRHGVRGHLRAAGRRLRLHRMPEVRGVAHPLPGPLP